MEPVEVLTPEVDPKPACEAFGISRAKVDRLHSNRNTPQPEHQKHPFPPRAHLI